MTKGSPMSIDSDSTGVVDEVSALLFERADTGDAGGDLTSRVREL